MSDLKNNGKVFHVSNARFVDKDGNEYPVPDASRVTLYLPIESASEPVKFEVADFGSFTLTTTDKRTINDLLRILGPREWMRRNWFKLPAIWKRK